MNPDDLVVRRDLVLPGEELAVATSRSGGPGGQNVNKVETRVTLRWNVRTSRALSEPQRARLLSRLASRLTGAGELLVHVDESPSQAQNRALARVWLADIVREALLVPKVRRPTRPTRGSQKRRVQGKKRRSDVKKGRGRPRLED